MSFSQFRTQGSFSRHGFLLFLKRRAFSALGIFAGFFLLSSFFWMTGNFGYCTVEQTIFHLVLPTSTEVQQTFALSFLIRVVLFSLAAALLACFVLARTPLAHPSGKWRLAALSAGFVFLGVFVLSGAFRGYDYLWTWFFPDPDAPDFYRERYVPVSPADVDMPLRRNLVVLTLESMEAAFGDTRVMPVNLMPELAALRERHQSVRDSVQVYGTGWTVAALVAMQCGIPLRAEAGNGMDASRDFLPGATSLTDILAAHGYRQRFLQSAALSFAGKDVFFATHGLKREELIDTPAMLARNPGDGTPENLHEWGLYDRFVYARAKEELNGLAARGEPFALFMLTVDTHHHHGYPDPTCPHDLSGSALEEESRDMAGAVLHADHAAAEFVKWIQAQPFAGNTTILVLNDHLLMESDLTPYLSERPELRRNFNVLINPARPLPDAERRMSHFDWAPTLLESMGAALPEGKMGFGVSLYAGLPTLVEEMGKDELEAKLTPFSPFYLSELMGAGKRKEQESSQAQSAMLSRSSGTTTFPE